MLDVHSTDDMPIFSGHRLGSYRLVRLLGQGGFGTVYLGEHLYLKRFAAIKLVRTALSSQDMASFLEESRLLAKLSHPRIVRVFEFAVAQSWNVIQGSYVKEHLPFLVMDYAPGGSLRSLYPSGTRLALNEVVNYIKQIADALQYAHEQNIIHRDIKPENLLMNEQREIMLSDFGLALFAPSPDFLSFQGMVGTLPYTAPEQLQGKPVFASDQYSLGILTYEWLCGSLPFQGSDVEIIMQHISSPPPSLHGKNPSISTFVEDIIFKALAKKPEQRYQTVQAFAQALEQASHTRKPFSITRPSLVAITPEGQGKRAFPAFHYLTQQASVEASAQNTFVTAYEGEAAAYFPTRPSTPMRRNRLRMLQKVHAFWIKGVLEKSLHGTAFITLEMDERPDTVETLWSPALQVAQPPHMLPSHTSIIEVYDQAGGELLILGEPGAGKTSLMLQLAHQLLRRAERDESLPIPVVFLLAAWAEKQLPFDQWIVEELSNKYQVPRPLGELWVKEEMLLPLLDGLDEVTAHARSACVTAINAFKKEHGLIPLVVCSRFSEYLLTSPRVLLQSAVVIRPLTMRQIDDYFNSLGQKFAGIVRLLREDPAFRRLVTTPLMLTIITRAYQERSPEELLAIRSPIALYSRILNAYVEQMSLRHTDTSQHSSQDGIRQISYLAGEMQRHNEKVLYIEHIQPDWLENIRWEQLYRYIAVMVPGAFIGALTGLLSNVLLFHAGYINSVPIDTVYGTFMGYLFSGKVTAYDDQPAPSGSTRKPFLNSEYPKLMLIGGLIIFLGMVWDKGWLAALLNGIFVGCASLSLRLLVKKRGKEEPSAKYAHDKYTEGQLKFFPLEHLRNGTLAGVACGLTSVITILVNPDGNPTTFSFLLTLGIRDSLRNALLGTLLSLLLANNDGFIHPAEIISWTWKRFLKGIGEIRNILYDLALGLMVGIIFASKQLFQGNIKGAGGVGISTGLLVAVGFHLTYAVFQGISNRNLDDNYRIEPNEGIRRSLSHGLIGGLISAPLVILLSIITSVISVVLGNGLPDAKAGKEVLTGIHMGLSNSLSLAPCGALLAFLLLGGLASLQHGALRLLLWRSKGLPLKLVDFLEHAVESVFLHKVGGGYIFIHRFLHEYFASRSNSQK
jgi:serine/threonine protein kinase